MKQILIVDDETNFLLSLEDGLRGFNDTFAISSAGNGKEAMVVLGKGGIDLVLSDIKMPEMDGLELLAKMSVSHPDVPVIIMTAFGSSAIEEKLESMGAFQYIEKPIDFDLLIDKVNEGLAAAEKGRITGVSLASFMQLLNLDKKTCTLNVTAGELVGTLFFNDGEVLNAFTDTLTGQDAALAIATWDPVEIEIQNLCRQRERVIEAPLGYILIESARMKDERAEIAAGGEKTAEKDDDSSAESLDTADSVEEKLEGLDFGGAPPAEGAKVREVDPLTLTKPEDIPTGAQEVDPATLQAEPDMGMPAAVVSLLETIRSMAGVTRSVLQHRDGTLLAEEANGSILSPFISTMLTESASLNNDLGFSEPRSMILNKETGEKVIIVPGKAIVVGLEVGNDAAAANITDSLRPIVRRIEV